MQLVDEAKTIVIKVGSALIADIETGEAYREWLYSLVEDIVLLKRCGKQVVVVTSGAVALGRNVLNLEPGTLALEEKQAAAACGMPMLLQTWREAFNVYDIDVAQILLTLDASEERRKYLNVCDTLDTLLVHSIVPIINENDSTTTKEIRVGDNDRLAARVAQMVDADMLILLSDVDGLYTADPAKDKNAKHIEVVEEISDEIRGMAGVARTPTGTGGMATKVDAAEIAFHAGCHTIITKGAALHPLQQLAEGARHTLFKAATTPLNARQQWIAGTLQPCGEVVVDDGAVNALHDGNSLLAVGVVAVEGEFDRGDAILVRTKSGEQLAMGLSAYKADNARLIMGKKSADIEGVLGYKGRDALIHKDDLVLL